MAGLSKEETIKLIEKHIEKLNTKDFNVYFLVLDTKGNPSGSLQYIYDTALTLFRKGYNVTMLNLENKDEFVGVSEWLGSEYDEIPHKRLPKTPDEALEIGENVNIGPSDFLFIPEIFANVMVQTKTLPCKRVIIMQNYNHLCEFMPVGVTPFNLNIDDIITTTETQENIAKDYFPGIHTYVVPPKIKTKFRNNNKPKKLHFNIVARNQSDVNRIIKPFYWKYPIYKWVTFRDLRTVTQDVFADALRESAFTIWVDDKTNFGYSALEAMRSGSIVLAKVPEKLTDWNIEETEEGKKLTDACIWFDDIDSLPRMIASLVRTWTMDEIPDSVYEGLKTFNDVYTKEQQEEAIDNVYVNGLFLTRKKEFEEVLEQLKNNGINVK